MNRLRRTTYLSLYPWKKAHAGKARVSNMKISTSKLPSQDSLSSKQPSLDTHESELRKQISDLQEKKKTISNDKEKTSEEKKKEKQAVQEEIQNLSSELRQYQIQKRQEEAAKKQEAIKEAARDANEKDSDKKQIPGISTPGGEESGVLISLSATKGQISGMKRIQSDLQRKQRTAATDEEKADLQKKVNTVAKNIGKKITITEDTVSTWKDSKKKGTGTKPVSDQAFDWKGQAEIVNAAEEPEEPYRGNLIANREKFFSTVSIFIS